MDSPDLILGKLRTQKSPRSGPTLSIERKNPVTKERMELLVPISKTKVGEASRQHSLDILRLPRGYDRFAQKNEFERVPLEVLKLRQLVFIKPVLSEGSLRAPDGWHAEESVCARLGFFAVELSGTLPVIDGPEDNKKDRVEREDDGRDHDLGFEAVTTILSRFQHARIRCIARSQQVVKNRRWSYRQRPREKEKFG